MHLPIRRADIVIARLLGGAFSWLTERSLCPESSEFQRRSTKKRSVEVAQTDDLPLITEVEK
jgi:hypothetical protein